MSANTLIPNNPLEQGHLEMLNQVLELENQQQQLLAACADCGLDVSKHKADSDRRHQLATAIKSRFFPTAV